MQIKSTVKYHLTLIGMITIIKKQRQLQREYRELLTLVHC